MRAALEVYEKHGATIVPLSLPHTRYALPTYYIIAPAEASSNLARYDGVRYGLREDGKTLDEMYEATRGKGFGAEVQRRVLIGTYVLSAGYYDAYYNKARRVRSLIAGDFTKAYETVDAIDPGPVEATAAVGAGVIERARVAIVPSVSYGVATVARNIPVAARQSIVIAAEQFPSNVYAWRRLAAERDGEVRTITASSDVDRGASWSEAVVDAIDERCAIVALPHVHWTDGTRFDLERIGARAREVGAAFIIDGTQSVGALPFDVQRIRPDAVIVAAYKWLLGPYGIGFGTAPFEFRHRGGRVDHRRIGMAVLLELEEHHAAFVLALTQRAHLLPVVGKEQHVAQEPVHPLRDALLHGVLVLPDDLPVELLLERVPVLEQPDLVDVLFRLQEQRNVDELGKVEARRRDRRRSGAAQGRAEAAQGLRGDLHARGDAVESRAHRAARVVFAGGHTQATARRSIRTIDESGSRLCSSGNTSNSERTSTGPRSARGGSPCSASRRPMPQARSWTTCRPRRPSRRRRPCSKRPTRPGAGSSRCLTSASKPLRPLRHLRDLKAHRAPEQCDTCTSIESASTSLAAGKIIGWFQGRCEIGPRALGNRSILASPTFAGAKDALVSVFFTAVLRESRNGKGQKQKSEEIFEHWVGPFSVVIKWCCAFVYCGKLLPLKFNNISTQKT